VKRQARKYTEAEVKAARDNVDVWQVALIFGTLHIVHTPSACGLHAAAVW
jgi:hypothetical protein